jgi:hypothetical protein
MEWLRINERTSELLRNGELIGLVTECRGWGETYWVALLAETNRIVGRAETEASAKYILEGAYDARRNQNGN